MQGKNKEILKGQFLSVAEDCPPTYKTAWSIVDKNWLSTG